MSCVQEQELESRVHHLTQELGETTHELTSACDTVAALTQQLSREGQEVGSPSPSVRSSMTGGFHSRLEGLEKLPGGRPSFEGQLQVGASFDAGSNAGAEEVQRSAEVQVCEDYLQVLECDAQHLILPWHGGRCHLQRICIECCLLRAPNPELGWARLPVSHGAALLPKWLCISSSLAYAQMQYKCMCQQVLRMKLDGLERQGSGDLAASDNPLFSPDKQPASPRTMQVGLIGFFRWLVGLPQVVSACRAQCVKMRRLQKHVAGCLRHVSGPPMLRGWRMELGVLHGGCLTGHLH